MCKVQKITATLTIAPTEVLVLDTNILLWTFYSKLTPKKVYQTKDYPRICIYCDCSKKSYHCYNILS